jgi:tyrosyl-tRNA synthetase
MPDDIPESEVKTAGAGLAIPNLLRAAGLVSSTSEAIRMIGQGAVRVDGERLEDAKRHCAPGATHVYQVGKRRFARVTVS